MAELSTITIGTETITLVSMPDKPGLRSFEPTAMDAASAVSSPYTGEQQIQWWPGADLFSAICTLPPLSTCDADEWISSLLACRGMLNGFMLGDPSKLRPRGGVTSASTPVVSGAGNVAGATTILTRGWKPNQFRLLLPRDYLQVGYRLHPNLSVVNSDDSGNATLSVWPSLRETLIDGQPIILNRPKGLFRLATNQRKWSSEYTRLTSLSFPIREYR